MAAPWEGMEWGRRLGFGWGMRGRLLGVEGAAVAARMREGEGE
jgi:hypothetical protein